MTQLGLLVTDASPLSTRAAADSPDCLTMPGLPVVIPDMMYFDVTQDLARTGTASILECARRHPGQVEIKWVRMSVIHRLATRDPAYRCSEWAS